MISDKKPLHGIFTAVPPRYDLINHIITLGMDVRWRWLAAKECLAEKPAKVLDLCCGTGDLALNIAQLMRNNVEITGLDYSQPMLDIASQKAVKLGLSDRASFRYGEVSNLPFPDNFYDCIGISFAFRNLTYKNPLIKQHLAEILRVLRPGGRFVIVESSQPGSPLIRRLFHFYLRWFVYRVGYLVSSHRGAYRYLAESAANYYSPGEMRELLLSAGFPEVRFRPLFLGAAGICIATK
jgi:demethylmenaquinone methyltransferase/2-methoxy-6-polyprenyl-1,4-benzoquinol methylase